MPGLTYAEHVAGANGDPTHHETAGRIAGRRRAGTRDKGAPSLTIVLRQEPGVEGRILAIFPYGVRRAQARHFGVGPDTRDWKCRALYDTGEFVWCQYRETMAATRAPARISPRYAKIREELARLFPHARHYYRKYAAPRQAL